MEQIKHIESGEKVEITGVITGFKKSLAGTQKWVRVKIGANEIWVREEDVKAETGRDV
jgi:hypothetical protein